MRIPCGSGIGVNIGHFPFNQEFRKFRDGKRKERQFPGEVVLKFLENENNRKIPFNSTIPARAQFLLAGFERVRQSRWRAFALTCDDLQIEIKLTRKSRFSFFFSHLE